jgi:DMSO/TMAO reductase YedYZ heme-binding membrane subunit
MYISLFGKRLRKITAELIISSILVSFAEVFVLFYAGFLKSSGLTNLLVTGAILAVIELALMFIIEEFLIAAKLEVKKRIRTRRTRRQ